MAYHHQTKNTFREMGHPSFVALAKMMLDLVSFDILNNLYITVPRLIMLMDVMLSRGTS